MIFNFQLRYFASLTYQLGKVLLILIIVSGGFTSIVCANENMDRRVQISLSLFPKIVAVDNGFKTKLTGENKVRLVFVYDRNKFRANELAEELRQSSQNIENVAVDSISVPLDEQLQDYSISPTAIFVAEPLGEDDFKRLILYGIKKRVIVFSPFSGDVERGATVGLSITTRVFPYFNNNTLQESGLDINPVLLEMSKRYE